MQGLASFHADNLFFRDLAAANVQYKTFSKKQADDRIAKGDKINTKDVFYFLEKSRDRETGEGFTLDELVAEAGLLILGDRILFA